MRNRSIVGIYALSLDFGAIAPFSMLKRELQTERHICSIARFISRFAPFVRCFDGNRRRNDGQDDDEKRRKDGIIFLKKISGQIGNERTGISTDKQIGRAHV